MDPNRFSPPPSALYPPESFQPFLSPQYHILKDLAEKPDVAVASAVLGITQLVSGLPTGPGYGLTLSKFLSETFKALFEVSRDSNYSQQSKLVHFVIQLQKHDVRDLGQNRLLTQYNRAIWTQLPGFTIAAEDLWIEDRTPENLQADDETKTENRTAFMAQLLAVAGSNMTYSAGSALDLSHLALRDLRAALEAELPYNERLLRMACLWMWLAGSKLWFLSRHGVAVANGRPGPRYERQIWQGFARSRWDVWRDGLEEAKRYPRTMLTGQLVENALVSSGGAMAYFV